MAAMALRAGAAFLILAQLCAFISPFLPFHKKSFKVGGIFTSTTMITYPTSLELENPEGAFCKALEHALPKKRRKFCGKDTSMGIWEARERMCASMVEAIFPDACRAMINANMLGMILVIVIFLDIVGTGCVGYLTYTYLMEKPKKQYRLISVYVVIGSLVVSFFVSILYYWFVIYSLDDMKGAPGFSLVISPSSANHAADLGYYVLWIALTFKGVALVLYKNGQSKEEIQLADLKEQMEWNADIQKANSQQGYGGYGNGAHHASPGYGNMAYSSGNNYGGYSGNQFQQPAPHGPTMAQRCSAPASPYQQANTMGQYTQQGPYAQQSQYAQHGQNQTQYNSGNQWGWGTNRY